MKDKFVVDDMLGSLARKLRIFGYDTLYNTEMGDDEILDIALKEERIVLTSSRKIQQKATNRKIKCELLNEENDYERLCKILQGKWGEGTHLFSHDTRCSTCNGKINQVSKSEVSNLVPKRVLQYQEEFYRCILCGKVYWIGGHWQRLYALSEKIIKRLQA
jgi:hypothetical protein